MSKNGSDGYKMGTIEKMLNAKPSSDKKRKPKPSKNQEQSPKKRGRKKKPPSTSKSKTIPQKKKRKKKSGTLVPQKTHSHAPAKVYELGKNSSKNEPSEKHEDRDIILQLPLTEEDIETYSLKNKEQTQEFLDNVLLEYNPYIVPFNPKPIIEKCDGEESVEYPKNDIKTRFRPCIKCILTIENSVIPCKDCAKIFDKQHQVLSIDDALLKRAEDDALYGRPDPAKFINEQIAETKLSLDTVVGNYDPNVIAEFSNEPSPFVHGKIKYMEEVQSSPFEYTMQTPLSAESQPQEPQEMVMSTPINSAPVEEIKKTKQFRILNEFSQLEKWPKRTNVYCWWDCHPFNSVPVAIPIRYNKKADIFMVYGCFCTFECAMAYKKSDRKLCKISNDLFYDLRKRYGHIKNRLDKDQSDMLSAQNGLSPTFVSIRSAMPRKALSIFGGKLSIQEFRKYSCMTTLSTKVYQFPLIPVNEIIEIVPKKYKNLELNRANSPPLKLKRSKPLPGSKNTLEHTLNLSRMNSKKKK